MTKPKFGIQATHPKINENNNHNAKSQKVESRRKANLNVIGEIIDHDKRKKIAGVGPVTTKHEDKYKNKNEKLPRVAKLDYPTISSRVRKVKGNFACNI